jgi:dynein heavy chain
VVEEEPEDEEEELDEDGEPIVKEKAVAARHNSADDKIECEMIDTEQGFYRCKYTMPDEGKVRVEILFEDDKQNMVHVRGSPYKASFSASAKPAENTMTGGALERHVKAEIQRLQDYMTTSKKECNTKDKDLKDVKQLLGVKETVEGIVANADKTTLTIDQLDEALILFQNAKVPKIDNHIKNFNKANKEWKELKDMQKVVKKEIMPLVGAEKDKNTHNIKNLEDSIVQFTQDMKKREFFQYKCGTAVALEKLDLVFDELKVFEDSIVDYGGNAAKFGDPGQITKATKDIEGIKITIDIMKVLWDHIDFCGKTFESFYSAKWIGLNAADMEDQVKKLMKTLKDMKVDKRANAYVGILDEIKKWIVFLPLITELANDAMLDRHWTDLKKKIGAEFTVDDKLVLKDIYDLNLGKYVEDVEEICDQAQQEKKMENYLKKVDEFWKDVCFEF